MLIVLNDPESSKKLVVDTTVKYAIAMNTSSYAVYKLNIQIKATKRATTNHYCIYAHRLRKIEVDKTK